MPSEQEELAPIADPDWRCALIRSTGGELLR